MPKPIEEIYQGLSRRHFLRASAGATLAALTAGSPRELPGADGRPIEPTADTMILLWMAGGMPQTETFDPKRYVPFDPGLESKRVLSTFPSIDTAVDNIKISQGLERIAAVMDRGTLIRSYRPGDLGFPLHARHQYHWHTGYAPPLPVAAPHMGAWIARTLGPHNPAVPAFIDVGQSLDIGAESGSLQAFHTAGFLGTEYGPFSIADPRDAAAGVRPPANVTPEQFQRRHANYQRLLANNPVMKHGSRYQQESLLRSVENAQCLLSSPAAQAFDLSLERRESFDKYNAGRFGLGCLLARRLTEAGARFIEVTTEYVPFRHWDTHENGHTRTAGMKQAIDQPVARLILDLEQRGLLDRTLVVLASEFGRDMIVAGSPEKVSENQVTRPDVIWEMKHYGMHRHSTEASCALVFGGGFKKGYLHGRTADEHPCSVVENPVRIEDLHATLYRAMGIAPNHGYQVEQRPFYLTKDGQGKPLADLLA